MWLSLTTKPFWLSTKYSYAKTIRNRRSPKKRELNHLKYSNIGFVLSVALSGGLAGCVGYVDGPRGEGYAPAPGCTWRKACRCRMTSLLPGLPGLLQQLRHEYVYQSGRSWVSRPAPPRVSVNVLFSSPSVNVGFHDSPANHHAEIARQYPKQWRSPEAHPDNHDNHNDHRGNDQRKN